MIGLLIKKLSPSVFCFSMVVGAQDLSSYRPYNPAGIVSVPPSSLQEGLINRSPEPVSPSDLIITGNVTGGRHFRATLPYTQPHTLNTELGSASLDAFLRHSGSADAIPKSSGMASPFYSPTGSVTRSIPGRAAVLAPSMLRPRAVTQGPGTPTNQQRLFTSPDIQTTLYSDPFFARQLIDLKAPSIPSGPGETYLRQFLQKQGILSIQDNDPTVSDSPQETAGPKELETPESHMLNESPDALPTFASEPMEAIEALTPTQWADYFKRQQAAEWDQELAPDGLKPEARQQDANAPGHGAWAQYATLKAFAQAKYEHFMRSAQDYQGRGDYDKAIDAYTLADTYRPNDPAASAGKGLALLARSRFSTSALFLARTLERDPAYAQVKIDLAAHIGGAEALHQRIEEAEVFLKRTGSFDLHFLLAYLYYQLNDLGSAQAAIDQALKKQPQHPGAKAVKQAIKLKLEG